MKSNHVLVEICVGSIKKKQEKFSISMQKEKEQENYKQPRRKKTAHERAREQKVSGLEKEFWNRENQIQSFEDELDENPKIRMF